MNLLKIEINKHLFLENYNFKHSENNIEFLNNLSLFAKNETEQLNLLNHATSKIEKFHSFFHFEQSYFHLQLAKKLFNEGKIKEAEKQLDFSIFQDHANIEALSLKNNQTIKNEYKRLYTNYISFLEFATEEKIPSFESHPHWQPQYNFEKIIEDLKNKHLNYHQQAARLYLNRAMVFKKIDEKALAKNDLVKASNLDSNLNNQQYFSEAIPYLANYFKINLISNNNSILAKATEYIFNCKLGFIIKNPNLTNKLSLIEIYSFLELEDFHEKITNMIRIYLYYEDDNLINISIEVMNA